MPATRDEILAYTDSLLDADRFSDYCPNGLQVIGADHVESIATAVSCTMEVFTKAADLGVQMLIVHHGLFWKGTPQVIGRQQRDRLAMLFDNDISLAGYHLPLDAHPELGNNALLRNGLGLTPDPLPFALIGGQPIGTIGTSPHSIAWDDFLERVRQVTGGREPLVLGDPPSGVRKVAICSGGAASELESAAALGADVLITGEPRESSHADALELGCALIAAGHYATETHGVRALGAHLADRFDIAHHAIDVTNPV
jgi:dinuclear metal center YbgI/SA1388 family protein